MDRIALTHHLQGTLSDIQIQIKQVKKDADEMGIDPYVMRRMDGGYILADLLASKTQVLASITELETSRPAVTNVFVNERPPKRSMAETERDRIERRIAKNERQRQERVREDQAVARRSLQRTRPIVNTRSGHTSWFNRSDMGFCENEFELDDGTQVSLNRIYGSGATDLGLKLSFKKPGDGWTHEWSVSPEICRQMGYTLFNYNK